MPAESEADRLSFFDPDDFGDSASIGGNDVAGILEEPYVSVDTSEGPVMSASAPIFYCRTSDVTSVTISTAVVVTTPVKVGSFTVVEIRPDGEGITALVLHDA